MFTGLIEAVGYIDAIEAATANVRLRIGTTLAAEMREGDSVSVNGVCLTATMVDAGHVVADVGPETLRVTTIGSLRPKQAVNLERAMRADARVGGHFVQGHVDGIGVVKDVRAEGESHWVTVSFDRALAAACIPKGSVTLDGISLTIAALRDDEFDVMIVPFTWCHTNVRTLRPGDRVNLEGDVIGKYVARAAQIALATL